MAQPQNQNNMSASVGAAVIGGLASLGSQILGTTASSNLNSRNRQWQHDEAELARQRAAEEWQREFNLVNEYNTPSAVKERLMDAGINPSVAFENVQTSAMSNASPQKNPTYAGPPATHPLQGIASTGGYEAAMRSIGSLVEAVKSAEFAPLQKQLLNKQIQNTASDANLKQAQADSTRFNLSLDQAFGSMKRSAELNNLISDTQRNYADIQLKARQGENVDADTYLKSAQALVEYAKKNLTELDAQHVQQVIDNYEPFIRSQIRQNNASAYRDVAAGNLSNEQSMTEQQIRPHRVRVEELRSEGQRLLNEYQDNENWVQSATAVAKVRQFIAQAQRENLITMQKQAELMQQLDNIVLNHSEDARKWIKSILTLGWSE